MIPIPKLSCLLSLYLAFPLMLFSNQNDPRRVIDPKTASEEDWVRTYDQIKLNDKDFRVESLDEFKKIVNYYEDILSDGIVVHSFYTAKNECIRCIELASQRSFLASGIAPGQLLRAPAQPPFEDNSAPGDAGNSRENIAAAFGLDGSLDVNGNARICPPNSFPKLLAPIENLFRFRRYEDIFQKYPAPLAPMPKPNPSKEPDGPAGTPARQESSATSGGRASLEAREFAVAHEYAHAARNINNTGSQADFTVWRPNVERSDEFSLSQLWVARGSGNDLQTAETGWQVYPGMYGDSDPHLFIFYTSANYASGSGCYNLDCTGFVQTDGSVVIAGSLSSYVSTVAGDQHHITLGFYRDRITGHWWLKFNTVWVGFYPNYRFHANGIANYSDSIDFGGEIVNRDINGLHTMTQMGSGLFPAEGWKRAADTRHLQYFDLDSVAQDAAGLTPRATNRDYYDLQLNYSTQDVWKHYFYFGGSGRLKQATLKSPSGATSTKTPTYTWDAVPGATWYGIWVNKAGAVSPAVIDGWVTANDAGCSTGTTCSITPTTNLQFTPTGYKALVNGNYQWWLQSWRSSINFSAWTQPMNFSVGSPPGKATLVSPTGSISTGTPTYTWNAIADATWYQLWVKDSSSSPKIQVWYTAAQAGCAAGTGTCSVTHATPLAAGLCTWWILTWNDAGYGPWSNPMDFTVALGQDEMVGLWDTGEGGQARMERRTSGAYTFVAKVTKQGDWWKQRGIMIGEEVWWLNKQADGHYSGKVLVKGNLYWTMPFDVWIKGNTMVDSTGKLIATKIQ